MEFSCCWSGHMRKTHEEDTRGEGAKQQRGKILHTRTKNTNIFEKDFVIVPINHEDHWYVVLICYPALTKPREYNGRVECPVMLLLDSLEDGMKDEVVANLREYLACEWREKMVVGQGQEVRLFQQSSMPHFCPDIPQQPNLTDCGLYLLEYVEAFFRSPIKDFSVPIASLA